MREEGKWHRFDTFFVADFINSDQILNEINFNEGIGLETWLGEKLLKDTEEVKYFQSGKDRSNSTGTLWTSKRPLWIIYDYLLEVMDAPENFSGHSRGLSFKNGKKIRELKNSEVHFKTQKIRELKKMGDGKVMKSSQRRLAKKEIKPGFFLPATWILLFPNLRSFQTFHRKFHTFSQSHNNL